MSAQKGYIVPLVLFGTLTLLSGIGLFFYFYQKKPETKLIPLNEPTASPFASSIPQITDFESCQKAGNPTQESYPRRCMAEGKTFTEVIIEEASASATPSSNKVKKCAIGGCSGQLCVEESPDGTASTCEWREEYGCYIKTKCEVQADGNCGWTENEQFKQCLEQAR
jgi:hypothetical protein